MAQTIRSLKASITLTSIKDRVQGRDLNRLDWIQDWDSDSTMVAEQKVVTPTMYAGTVNKDENGNNISMTGVALGKSVFEDNPYSVGVAVYNGSGSPTIKFFSDGSAVFGTEENRQLIVRNNGDILTPKIRVTDVNPDFVASLDLSYNVSLPGELYASNNRILYVNQNPTKTHFQIALAKEAHLMGHFIVSGYTDSDTNFTVNMIINNTLAPFCPLVQSLKKGDFVIGIPCAFAYVPKGVNYAFLELISTNGTATIDLYNMEFSIEGKYLIEAVNVKPPHAEVDQSYLPIFIDYHLDDVKGDLETKLADSLENKLVPVMRNTIGDIYNSITVDSELNVFADLIELNESVETAITTATEETYIFGSKSNLTTNIKITVNEQSVDITGETYSANVIKSATNIYSTPLSPINDLLTDVVRTAMPGTYKYDKYSNVTVFDAMKQHKQSITLEAQTSSCENIYTVAQGNKMGSVSFKKIDGYVLNNIATTVKTIS